jgi:predicted nuclease with TOPRIM domain
MGKEEKKELSVEELQQENSKLRTRVNNLQTYIQEVLDKTQKFMDGIEMQKKGLMADLSETVQQVRNELGYNKNLPKG